MRRTWTTKLLLNRLHRRVRLYQILQWMSNRRITWCCKCHIHTPSIRSHSYHYRLVRYLHMDKLVKPSFRYVIKSAYVRAVCENVWDAEPLEVCSPFYRWYACLEIRWIIQVSPQLLIGAFLFRQAWLCGHVDIHNGYYIRHARCGFCHCEDYPTHESNVNTCGIRKESYNRSIYTDSCEPTMYCPWLLCSAFFILGDDT